MALTAEVEKQSPQTVENYRNRLYQKLCTLLADRNIDDARILTEAAIFADRIAVDEETVRLKSHVEQFKGILESNEPNISLSIDCVNDPKKILHFVENSAKNPSHFCIQMRWISCIL